MRRLVPLALAMVAVIGFTSFGVFGAAADPKFTIKEVMAKAHKSGLCKTVAGGKATKEEKAELAELYVALAANKCPKGDAADWKERTEALVKISKAIVDGKEAAEKEYAKILNCGACHKEHK